MAAPTRWTQDEPLNLARTIAKLKLKYVVITSVDRDDLRDGGAGHFVECIRQHRANSRRSTQIEILTPDFRGRDDRALEILKAAPPDVMNHNLETITAPVQGSAPGLGLPVQPEPAQEVQGAAPRRADQERHHGGPGRDRRRNPCRCMRDMRAHDIDMLTIGQYLAPTQQPPAGAPLRTPRHLQDVRGRGLQDGLHARRRGCAWCAPATTPTSQAKPAGV
jgi:lipoic acid synthetase